MCPLSPPQSKHDLFTFGETIKDYIALLGAIRVRTGGGGGEEKGGGGEGSEWRGE